MIEGDAEVLPCEPPAHGRLDVEVLDEEHHARPWRRPCLLAALARGTEALGIGRTQSEHTQIGALPGKIGRRAQWRVKTGRANAAEKTEYAHNPNPLPRSVPGKDS